MTGIVVVSHSRALADAAVALAMEMVHGSTLRIEVAAGLDATTFGTDASAIMSAIETADDGVGVVVLMDLGSAILSAELALDLIDPRLRERVLLCAAPLVEGLVVAAVAAAGGAFPAEVADEAASALAAKQAHIQPPSAMAEGSEAVPGESSATTPVVGGEFEVLNPHGLHARPAARLVQEARLVAATVELRNLTADSAWVPATSLSKVALLGALCGHVVEVRATGDDADRAVSLLIKLAGERFGERVTEPARVVAEDSPGTASEPSAIANGVRSGGVVAEDSPWTAAERSAIAARGLPGAPGVAVGPVVRLVVAAVEIPDQVSDDPAEEWRCLQDALDTARAGIVRVRGVTAHELGADEAAIFDAHLLLLADTDLLADARQRIDAGTSAPRAWADATDALAAQFDAVADPYLRARAADVRAVGDAVLRAALGSDVATGVVNAEGIVVAVDLTPAQVADLDLTRVLGLALSAGSPTGHSAILARARGIATVVCAGDQVLSLPEGSTLAIDGGTGEFVVDPTSDVIAEFGERRRLAGARAARALSSAGAAAVTTDGVEILVGANLGSVEDARAAAAAGADLAGLVRTEFLFLDRPDAPDVDEQVAAYLALADALGGRRITLRTLDVGGDKPLPYAPQPAEENPFLGVRGIRLALAQQTLLDAQLLAIIRTAHETPVSVMFPMVSVLDELIEVRRRLDATIEADGRGTPAGLHVGIMVEVPSAALKAASLVPYVDFFSIGTNDLTQYTLAAERGNPAVAALADPLDPGVIALVDLVCQAAGDGPLVAVCGELASDERAAALLVAMGVRELSVVPPAVPGVKESVRRICADDTELVKRCLAAPSAAEVRALLS